MQRTAPRGYSSLYTQDNVWLYPKGAQKSGFGGILSVIQKVCVCACACYCCVCYCPPPPPRRAPISVSLLLRLQHHTACYWHTTTATHDLLDTLFGACRRRIGRRGRQTICVSPSFGCCQADQAVCVMCMYVWLYMYGCMGGLCACVCVYVYVCVCVCVRM